jgi:hypothetical protein
MIDCGGPCDPCPTCDDSIRNQGEEGVDCGGPCPPCPEKCIQAITFAINVETGQCMAFNSPCDIPEGWRVVDECPPIQPVYIFLYIIVLAFIATASALIWLHREDIKRRIRYYLSRWRSAGGRIEKKKLTREETLGKEAIDRISAIRKGEREKKKEEDENKEKSQ